MLRPEVGLPEALVPQAVVEPGEVLAEVPLVPVEVLPSVANPPLAQVLAEEEVPKAAGRRLPAAEALLFVAAPA
jgi:hypothetical protein